MTSPLIYERNWADKTKYEDAERQHWEQVSKLQSSNRTQTPLLNSSSHSANMPNSKPTPNPPAQQENGSADPDKKKKRRKRNNKDSSANNAQEAAAAGGKSSAPQPQQQQAAAPAPEPEKKQPVANMKERKNEANKKGKKQNSESDKGLLPPAINQQDEKISLASEVAKARQHIKSSLECVDRLSTLATNQGGTDLVHRIVSLEKENDGLKKLVEKMQKAQDSLESRLAQLEKQASNLGGSTPAPKAAPAPAKAPAPADDDDVDLFGSSDEEDEEAQKVREQRLQEYAAKKSKKPALIAKSNLILDVKPWDDETDMKELEAAVRSIVMDGLLWGASKMVPLAYGIHKLQISAVIEDEKVSVDLLTESIEGKEDFVQSVDIAAFNKI